MLRAFNSKFVEIYRILYVEHVCKKLIENSKNSALIWQDLEVSKVYLSRNPGQEVHLRELYQTSKGYQRTKSFRPP